MDIDGFVNGNYNTHFIEDNKELLKNPQENRGDFEDIAVITAAFDYMNKIEKLKPCKVNNSLGNNWKDFGRKKAC